jgi:acyl dehydratase
LTLEELPGLVGVRLGVSSWVTVEQDQIDRFAALNGDDQWIHVDVERAGRERGGTIAHAFLVMSLMSAMTREIVRYEGISHGFNYGFDRLRFTGPTPAGARIRLVETLTAVEPRGDGVLLRRGCVVEVEGRDRPALVGDWLILLIPHA